MRRVMWRIAVVLCSVALVLGGAAWIGAKTSLAASPTLTVSPDTVPPGGVEVELSATGFNIVDTDYPASITFDGVQQQSTFMVPCGSTGNSLSAGFGLACNGQDYFFAVPAYAAPGVHTIQTCVSPPSFTECASTSITVQQVAAPTAVVSPSSGYVGMSVSVSAYGFTPPPSTAAPTQKVTRQSGLTGDVSFGGAPVGTVDMVPCAARSNSVAPGWGFGTACTGVPVMFQVPSLPAGPTDVTVCSSAGECATTGFTVLAPGVVPPGQNATPTPVPNPHDNGYPTNPGPTWTAIPPPSPTSTPTNTPSPPAPPANTPTNTPTSTPTLTPTVTATPCVTQPEAEYEGIHDGYLTNGWVSAAQITANQHVTFAFAGTATWSLTDILIDPAATKGDPATSDVNHFTVLVSTTGLNQSDFTPILSTTVDQGNAEHVFHLTTPVNARYVQLDAVDNYGGKHVAVDEFGAYGRPVPGTVELRHAARHLNLSTYVRQLRPAAQGTSLAKVRAIINGLQVQAPKHQKQNGKVQQPLFQQYLAETGVQQKAQLRFEDQTTLNMGQRTAIVLQNPHVTFVKNGQIDQTVAPGSDHRVQTDAIVASAIGTNYIVRVTPADKTIVIVIEGSVLVQNAQGSVVVKTGQETTAVPDEAPTPPVAVDTSGPSAWTKPLPPADLPWNGLLDANGGTIVAVPQNCGA